MSVRVTRLALAAALAAIGCGGDTPAAPSAPSSAAGTFASGAIRLSYALDLPTSPGPHPAFVLGHGSGRVTKDEARPLAARLTALGFAVLRYDKRGVGASTGTYEGVGVANSGRVIEELAEDMAAGVAFLETRSEIDPRRIGLVGVSQAGWVMPAAAARSGRVRFMALVVGPTVSVGEEIFYSALAEHSTTPLDDVYPQLSGFEGPRGYDPRDHLAGLDTPGLWILGAEDRSIPTRSTVAILQQLRSQGRPYQWIVHPDAGHDLINLRSGAPIDFVSDIATFADASSR